MKKYISCVLTFVLIVFNSLYCSAENKKEKILDWGIYIYICGSDLETNYGAASSDLAEIQKIQLPENIAYYIQTGGAKEWKNDDIDDYSNTLLRYDCDGLEILDSTEWHDMANPATLKKFVEFSKEQKAKHKIFIFWNHGLGTVGGVCYDEISRNTLSIDDLRNVFSETVGIIYEKPYYDIIGFDACLMSTIDVANSMCGVGKYMIASQETEPVNGWSYTNLSYELKDNPEITASELGKNICNNYYSNCMKNNVGGLATMALWDLKKVPELIEAYNNIASEALEMSHIIDGYGVKISRAVNDTVNFGGNNSARGYTDMIDLGSLISNNIEYFPKNGKKILDMIDKTIIYKANGLYRNSASGVSVYYPLSNDRERFEKYSSLKNIQSVYVNLYNDMLHNDSMLEEYRFRSLQHIKIDIDKNGFPSVKVPKDLLKLVKSASMGLVSYKPGDRHFTIMGIDDYVKSDWENGKFTIVSDGKWGSLNGHPLYVIIDKQDGDQSIYTVPIKLNGEERTMIVGFDIKNKINKILGTVDRVGLFGGNTNDKIIPLKNGDKITIIMYQSEVGAGISELKPIEKETIIFDADTKVEDVMLPDGIYGCCVEFDSITGNYVVSDIALYNKKNGTIFPCDLNGMPLFYTE